MSEWLVGRQEIADYAKCSVWTVTAMIKAGLECSGGNIGGSPPKTTKLNVDKFYKNNPNFIASHYHKAKI